MVSKLFYMMVFGAVGGVLAWFVNEPFISDDIRRTVDWGEIARFGSLSGLFIGAMIGLATGSVAGHGQAHPACGRARRGCGCNWWLGRADGRAGFVRRTRCYCADAGG